MRQPVFFRYDPSRENAFGALRGAHLKSSNLPIKNPPGEHRRGDFFQDLLRLAANIGQNAAIGVEDLAVHEVGCVAGAPFGVACMSGLDEGASDGMVCSLVKWSHIGCDCSV